MPIPSKREAARLNGSCFSRIPLWLTAVTLSLALVVLPSLPKVRAVLSAPLLVHSPDAQGEACYVLAGGGSLWERLDAAADLLQMQRVSRIILIQDNRPGRYSFKANSSWTRVQWSLDYLSWRGIAPAQVTLVAPQDDGWFGTLSEARTMARRLPKDVKRLVLVSSAPHMRRAVLAFRRALPSDVQVVPYAATEFPESYELYYPIWTEYVKLLVYSVVS